MTNPVMTTCPCGCKIRQTQNNRLYLQLCPLHAATPGLLEALADCVSALETVHDMMPRHNCTVGCPDISKHVARARAAIAKAENTANQPAL